MFIWNANIAFLLLFPGFFFYQSMIGLGIIPALLGGYFGIVALLVFPLTSAGFVYLNKKRKTNYTIIDYVFFSVVVLTIFISLTNYSLGTPSNYSVDMLKWSLSGLLFNLVTYFLANTISFDSKLFKLLVVGSVGVMALIVFYNIGAYGIFYLKAEDANSEHVATYQGFARSLAVVGLLSVAILQNKKKSFLIFLLTSAALFFNGARTEFVLFFVSYISLLVYLSTRSVRRMFVVLMLLIAGTIVFAVNLEILLALLPSNRMLQLVDIGSSTSGMARIQYALAALETISNNPLLGDYGSYVNFGGVGSYSHNLLSAWVNLGLFGFSLYVFAILMVTKGLVMVVLRMKPKTTEERVMFVFAVFTILALIVAKDYSYMLFGMMIGFYSRARYSYNKAMVRM